MLFLLSACAGAPPIPPPLEPRVWQAAGEPRGVILALHSFGDHAAAFNLAAPALAEAGYSVYAFDQAGFGTRNLNDRWAGEARLVDDAAGLARQLAERYPDRPLYLLGESLGGAVAMLMAARPPDLPVDGLILAAPAVREGIRLRYGGRDTSVPAVGIQRLRDRLGAHGDYQTFPQGPHLLLQGRHWPRVTATIKRWAGARATPR